MERLHSAASTCLLRRSRHLPSGCASQWFSDEARVSPFSPPFCFNEDTFHICFGPLPEVAKLRSLPQTISHSLQQSLSKWPFCPGDFTSIPFNYLKEDTGPSGAKRPHPQSHTDPTLSRSHTVLKSLRASMFKATPLDDPQLVLQVAL